jgi:hypothetical protein
MHGVTTTGLDLAKNVFQVHGIDAEGRAQILPPRRARTVLRPLTSVPCRRGGLRVCSSLGARDRGVFAISPVSSMAKPVSAWATVTRWISPRRISSALTPVTRKTSERPSATSAKTLPWTRPPMTIWIACSILPGRLPTAAPRPTPASARLPTRGRPGHRSRWRHARLLPR